MRIPDHEQEYLIEDLDIKQIDLIISHDHIHCKLLIFSHKGIECIYCHPLRYLSHSRYIDIWLKDRFFIKLDGPLCDILCEVSHSLDVCSYLHRRGDEPQISCPRLSDSKE